MTNRQLYIYIFIIQFLFSIFLILGGFIYNILPMFIVGLFNNVSIVVWGLFYEFKKIK